MTSRTLSISRTCGLSRIPRLSITVDHQHIRLSDPVSTVADRRVESFNALTATLTDSDADIFCCYLCVFNVNFAPPRPHLPRKVGVMTPQLLWERRPCICTPSLKLVDVPVPKIWLIFGHGVQRPTDLLTLKLGHGSPVSWASFQRIFSLLFPSIFDLASGMEHRRTVKQTTVINA